jgi:hypothetical protein
MINIRAESIFYSLGVDVAERDSEKNPRLPKSAPIDWTSELLQIAHEKS